MLTLNLTIKGEHFLSLHSKHLPVQSPGKTTLPPPEDRAVNMLYKGRKNQPYKNSLFIDFVLNQLNSPLKI